MNWNDHCDDVLYHAVCREPVDVVLAVDTSTSIGRANLVRVFDFCQSLIVGLDSRSRFALVTFSDRARLVMNFTQLTSYSSVDVLSASYPAAASTDVAGALRVVHRLFASASVHQRRVALFIVDGRSTRWSRAGCGFADLRIKLSAQLKWNWNRTETKTVSAKTKRPSRHGPWRQERFVLAETKQFQNCFKTVLKLFCFSFVSVPRVWEFPWGYPLRGFSGDSHGIFRGCVMGMGIESQAPWHPWL